MRSGSCSPSEPRSPTGCWSSASGICGRSWPSMRPIPTDGALIEAAGSSHPGPTTPSPTFPGTYPAPAHPRRTHQRVRAGRIESQVRTSSRVLEPHTVRPLRETVPGSRPGAVHCRRCRDLRDDRRQRNARYRVATSLRNPSRNRPPTFTAVARASSRRWISLTAGPSSGT